MILPADKGKATVVMDTSKYQTQIEGLLADTNTYTPLTKAPTNRYKDKLIKLLKEWKQQGKISQQLYWRLYPNADEPPKLYGTPKIHKQGAPFVLSSQAVAA